MFKTHGMTRTPTYRSWSHMVGRCRNPQNDAWHNYGGRGIQVCARWNSFESFLADMGERPAGMSIDRINNDGNYEPGNCRWATTKQQRMNARTNHMVTFNGKTQSVTEWAKETGIPRNCIYLRLTALGWSPKEALTKPTRAASIKPANRVYRRTLTPAGREHLQLEGT